MTPHVVVVDTNVVVSGLISGEDDAPTVRILDGMLRGRFGFLLSADLLAEYRAVLLRPRIRQRHGLTETNLDATLAEIVANARFREGFPKRNATERGHDDHLWELVEAEPGAMLVTGDREVRQSAGPVTVLSPRAFLELLSP